MQVPGVLPVSLALIVPTRVSSRPAADDVVGRNAVLRCTLVMAGTPGAWRPPVAASIHVASVEA